MSKAVNKNRLILFSIALAMALVIFLPYYAAGPEDPFTVMEKKLSGISKDEKQTLQNLFVLAQEIEAMEKEESHLKQVMDQIESDIRSLEISILKEEGAYKKNQNALKEILKSYQRMGAGSYVEILLESDSLASFLRRVNILRDITRNTGALMTSLEESQIKLKAEKTSLAGKLADVENHQAQLSKAIDKKLQLKTEMEKYLVSLKEKSVFYQQQLADVQRAWDEVVAQFPLFLKALSNIVAEGGFPEDAMKYSFSYRGITETMEDKTLNELLEKNPVLSSLKFKFKKDKVEIDLAKWNLTLTGRFVIEEAKTLRFEVDSGSFYGMPLETGAVKALFKQGSPAVNLSSLLDGYKLTTIEVFDGYLVLLVVPAIIQ